VINIDHTVVPKGYPFRCLAGRLPHPVTDTSTTRQWGLGLGSMQGASSSRRAHDAPQRGAVRMHAKAASKGAADSEKGSDTLAECGEAMQEVEKCMAALDDLMTSHPEFHCEEVHHLRQAVRHHTCMSLRTATGVCTLMQISTLLLPSEPCVPGIPS
jgi:hypothetical protein